MTGDATQVGRVRQVLATARGVLGAQLDRVPWTAALDSAVRATDWIGDPVLRSTSRRLAIVGQALASLVENQPAVRAEVRAAGTRRILTLLGAVAVDRRFVVDPTLATASALLAARLLPRENPAPKAWSRQRPGTTYPCKARHLGATFLRSGRTATVVACATPSREAPKVGRYRVQYPSGGWVNLPKPTVSRAIRRAARPLPVCPDWRTDVGFPHGPGLTQKCVRKRDGSLRSVPIASAPPPRPTAPADTALHFEDYNLTEGPFWYSDDAGPADHAVRVPDPTPGAWTWPTDPAARTAFGLAAAAKCLEGVKRTGPYELAVEEARRRASAAERAACTSRDRTACREFREALERADFAACRRVAKGACDHVVSRAQVERYRSGHEALPPVGPYELATAHNRGGSPCCDFAPETRIRRELQDDVGRHLAATNPRASEAALYAAIRDAEREHPLRGAWEACDARFEASVRDESLAAPERVSGVEQEIALLEWAIRNPEHASSRGDELRRLGVEFLGTSDRDPYGRFGGPIVPSEDSLRERLAEFKRDRAVMSRPRGSRTVARSFQAW